MSVFSNLLEGLSSPLVQQGASAGLLAGTQAELAQKNTFEAQQQAKYAVDQQLERQNRAGSLTYATTLGSHLMDPDWRADADRNNTLGAWEDSFTRHMLYGSGGYPSSILDPSTPLPEGAVAKMGDEGTAWRASEGSPGGSPPLSLILPESMTAPGDATGGGTAAIPRGTPPGPAGNPGQSPGLPGAFAPGNPAVATPADTTNSLAPGSPLPSTPPAGLPADALAGMSRLSVVGSADNEGTPTGQPVSAVEGWRQGYDTPQGTAAGPVYAQGGALGTTQNPLVARDSVSGVPDKPLGQQGGVPLQTGANTAQVVLPPAGTEGGVDRNVSFNQLVGGLQVNQAVMDGNYSSATRMQAAQNYTGIMTQVLTNQLTQNQIVQLREQIALLPAEAQAALIKTLSEAAGNNANAQATIALINPTAAKFQGEANQANAEAGLLGEEKTQLPRQVGAQVATAEAAKISAKASFKEAQVRQNELQQQIVQWSQAPGRQAAGQYFQGLVAHMYQQRVHQVAGGIGGQGKAIGGIIGAGGHANYQGGETYTVLDTGVAVQLIAIGFPGAWAALSQARIRGVDTPGGSSSPVPDDDTLRGAVLAINGAQAALQAAGPPGSKGYQQVFALIQKGQQWLSTVPKALAGGGSPSPDNATPGTTYDTGARGGNSVSDRIQSGILGAGKTLGQAGGRVWNFLNTPLPGTLQAKK